MNPPAAARHWAVRWLGEAEQASWKGWDPYDGLNFPGSRFLTLRQKWIRIALIQFFKRSPINFRPVFGIPQHVNPKALALFAAAALELSLQESRFEGVARRLLDELFARQKRWKNGKAWGYPFDWQSRAFFAPAGTPNVVVTSFAADALLEGAERLKVSAYRDAAYDAARFVAEDLNCAPTAHGLCFSYTPLDHSRIDNANLLAAQLLARTGKASGETSWARKAQEATAHALSRQKTDGSWTYGEASNQGWIDHFHTGFNLVALDQISTHLESAACADAVKRGLDFYLDHFFEQDGAPRYYADNLWPIDIHSAAQALMTLARFRDRSPKASAQLSRTTVWTLKHMVQPVTGGLVFQRHRFWSNTVPYRRWSQAWMCRAMTALLTCEPNCISVPSIP